MPVSEDSQTGGRLEALHTAGLIVRYAHGDLEALATACERAPAVSLADIYTSWSTALAPQPTYIAANILRHQIRQQANKLIALGRRKEAMQLLVKAVRTDLASKNPNIILEGLLEVAGDMTALDPRHANTLIEKARQVAANSGLKLEHFQTRTAAPMAI